MSRSPGLASSKTEKSETSRTLKSDLKYAPLVLEACCESNCVANLSADGHVNKYRTEYGELKRNADRQKFIYERFWDISDAKQGFSVCRRALIDLFHLSPSTVKKWREHFEKLEGRPFQPIKTLCTSHNQTDTSIRELLSAYCAKNLGLSSNRIYAIYPEPGKTAFIDNAIKVLERAETGKQLPIPNTVQNIVECTLYKHMIFVPTSFNTTQICPSCALAHAGIKKINGCKEGIQAYDSRFISSLDKNSIYVRELRTEWENHRRTVHAEEKLYRWTIKQRLANDGTPMLGHCQGISKMDTDMTPMTLSYDTSGTPRSARLCSSIKTISVNGPSVVYKFSICMSAVEFIGPVAAFMVIIECHSSKMVSELVVVVPSDFSSRGYSIAEILSTVISDFFMKIVLHGNIHIFMERRLLTNLDTLFFLSMMGKVLRKGNIGNIELDLINTGHTEFDCSSYVTRFAEVAETVRARAGGQSAEIIHQMVVEESHPSRGSVVLREGSVCLDSVWTLSSIDSVYESMTEVIDINGLDSKAHMRVEFNYGADPLCSWEVSIADTKLTITARSVNARMRNLDHQLIPARRRAIGSLTPKTSPGGLSTEMSLAISSASVLDAVNQLDDFTRAPIEGPLQVEFHMSETPCLRPEGHFIWRHYNSCCSNDSLPMAKLLCHLSDGINRNGMADAYRELPLSVDNQKKIVSGLAHILSSFTYSEDRKIEEFIKPLTDIVKRGCDFCWLSQAKAT